MAGREGAGWARVSTLAGQDEKNQLPDIYAYAQGNGVAIRRTWELKESAYAGDQEAHQREVIEYAKAHPGLVFISWGAVDRVERRGTRYALRFLLDLEDAGGEWHITGHGQVTVDDLPGLITLGLGAQKAHDESALKSDRVRVSFNKRDSAAWPGGKTWTSPPGDRIGAFRGKVPFGYTTVSYPPGKDGYRWLVPHPVESSLVTKAYERMEREWSQERIADWWSAELGRNKNHNAVTVVVHNVELYALGMYRIRKRRKLPDGTVEQLGVFIHEVEPLVDIELANRALAVKAGRKSAGPKVRTGQGLDFSAVLTCGRCGEGRMYRKMAGDAYQYRRYVCENCGHGVSADKADAQVEQLMAGDTTRVYDNAWVAGVSGEAMRARIDLEIAQIGQRGLPVDQMIAELQRLQAARDNIPEDTPGHWILRDLGITHGERWAEATSQQARIDLCRELWDWKGQRGPEWGSVVVERTIKDGHISPRKLDGLFRQAREDNPEFLPAELIR